LAATAGARPTVKFPNDVLLDGRKVAGILAEAAHGRVVLGIGINVNQRKTDLPPDVAATSLRIAARHEVERAPLLASVLTELEGSYEEWVSALAASG
jgi:BirA family biotin operon repressor/biotin-[acetyl-CoA-carboxylase] ligase